MSSNISYVNQQQAKDMDVAVIEGGKFTIIQLMEQAGLSCACAISKEYSTNEYDRVLVIIGPGHNGGDGLVATRHLATFGYKPTIYYPKKSRNEDDVTLMNTLLQQALAFGATLITDLPSSTIAEDYDLVVDSILGFNASGAIRSPFDSVIHAVNDSGLPVVCVDIPSGWDVNEGDIRKEGIKHADMLISLTAPKACARFFKGRYHYLGGRFVINSINEQFHLRLPAYKECELCVRLN